MNILDEIVERRKSDISQLGLCFGHSVPQERVRPVRPFIKTKGAVLEIKRASPSKGDIAPNLDAAQTALAYCNAGASAISVLTESNWFKGTLEDLQNVCAAVDKFSENQNASQTGNWSAVIPAVLRKDFLLFPDEIDVSYRAGADAVLLIARILSADVMAEMIKRCVEKGITPFVELRLEEDLKKVSDVLQKVKCENIVFGVNARDLKDFSIDLLTPVGVLKEIQKIASADARVIFESGIRSPLAAHFAGSLGFTGMLLGEAAAKNPADAGALVSNFVSGKKNPASLAWIDYAEKLRTSGTKPFVKICGLTNADDAIFSAKCGADFLGFIFCAASPRNTTADVVREVRKQCKTKLVGVITECNSPEGEATISLAKEGVIDFIQLHGEIAVKEFFENPALIDIPHYAVVNVSDENDLQKITELQNFGEARILIDAKCGDKIGGTGKNISLDLVKKCSSKTKVWLAGGITPDNVRDLVSELRPELIDVSSGVEASAGVKDIEKIKALFAAIK